MDQILAMPDWYPGKIAERRINQVIIIPLPAYTGVRHKTGQYWILIAVAVNLCGKPIDALIMEIIENSYPLGHQ
jgi:hypothetical protein